MSTPLPSPPPAVEASTATFNRQQAADPMFANQDDFEAARRGFLATIESGVIQTDSGKQIYNMQQFDFLQGDAPDSANPFLWRQGILNSIHGLFEVVPDIYQVRGFDLANMSIIRGKTGWIIIDPLTTGEAGAAALALVNETLGERPVSAVIVTHSHADHFGGLRGVLTDEDLESGRIPLIVPKDFLIESVSENLMAGIAMGRRASYQFGTLLPKHPQGNIGAGLGQTVSVGQVGLMQPTLEICATGETHTVDGVEIVFQLTPGAEAPAEMMFYFPHYKAFMQAEEINHTLHNLYTLRGATVRNGLMWSRYIDEAIRLFGHEVEVSFGSHHWPTWGREKIIHFMKGQRDSYRYIHDETLRLANHGYTLNEIAEMVKLPESLSSQFANRSYYGTVSHNVKAQYQLYFGWFDGNPANLWKLPPCEEGAKYVEYMGGAEQVLERAQADYTKGEYRFVATVLSHVIFADPTNQAARTLLGRTYAQLGYQAESGPWRNFYLSAAQELRDGIQQYARPEGLNADLLRSMPLQVLYDYYAVILNGPKAAGKVITLNMNYPDIGVESVLYIENGVLNHAIGKQEDKAHATVEIARKTLDLIFLRQLTFPEAIKTGLVKISGEPQAFLGFLMMLDQMAWWFAIAEPGDALQV